MAEFQFTPIDGYKNTVSFPKPSSGTESRAQLQSLLDQLRDVVNVFHGTNGAENIGIPLSIEGSGINLKQRVEWLYTQIANAILNQVADDSVKDIKLSNDPADIKARFTAFVNTMTELTSELSQRLDRNSYDDYQLWLELYYKGTISHVEADNAKAIMFDGFADTVNVDTTNSNATVDVTNKKVTLENIDVLLRTGSSQYSIAGVSQRLAQTFTAKKTSKLTSVLLRMNTGVTSTCYLSIVNTDTYGAPLMSSVVASEVSFATTNSGLVTKTVNFTDITLQEGVKYAIVLRTVYPTQSSIFWYYTTSGTGGYQSTDSGSSWDTPTKSFFVDFIFDYISPSTLITDPKAIPFLPTSMKLYQSVKKPAGTTITTTISADNGTNYETPTLVSSRPDPKFDGYTEEEYDLTISNVGQTIKLKSVLTGANRDEVEIKRYGLIIS